MGSDNLIDTLRHYAKHERSMAHTGSTRADNAVAFDKAADRITALEEQVEAMREALDDALDFVVDVVNEAQPGGIYHTNAVACHKKARALINKDQS